MPTVAPLISHRPPRRRLVSLALAACLALCSITRADDTLRPAFDVAATAASAALDRDGDASILLLQGDADTPQVLITAGEATLRADAMIVRSRKVPGSNRRRLDIVMLGNARWDAAGASSEGDSLVVNVVADGPLDLDADRRRPRGVADQPLLDRGAAALEWAEIEPLALDGDNKPPATTQARDATPQGSAVAPTLPPTALAALQASELKTTIDDRGKLAVEATGGVFVIRETPDGGMIELSADRAVLFTALERLDDAADLADPADFVRNLDGIYLEGDVRVTQTPKDADRILPVLDRRLRAKQAYYDFGTGRATLGEAVLHARSSGLLTVPLTVRAKTIRRVSDDLYEARNAQLSTSSFRTPMLSINAGRVYVRDRGDALIQQTFGADNVTPRVFGVPVFYLPIVRGGTAENRLPLRDINFGDDSTRGTFISTTWGLRETLGLEPIDAFDATYTVAYYGDRGLYGGADFNYGSDLFLNVGGGRPTLFSGDAKLEILDDEGRDNLPGRRVDEDRDLLRGRFFYEHEQFFPGGATYGGEDYALFARYGVLSDPTYLEIFDRNAFYRGPAHDLSLAVARRGSNTYGTLRLNVSTEDFATVADQIQENAAVERLPELTGGTYGQRIGAFTFNSEARLGAMAFDRLSDDINDDFNFRSGERGYRGVQSYGYTGQSEQVVPRLDLRQELAFAGMLGPVRARPFVVARATGWGETPLGDAAARVLGGVGVSLSSVFARIDDRPFSRILGVDRLRHLIEPYADAFAGVSAGREVAETYIFDEDVDVYGTMVGGRVGLRQRWQTYRGPPGGKRSVDLFVVDVSTSLFSAGSDLEAATEDRFDGGFDDLDRPFRGVYYATRPEASIPTDVAEASVGWAVSDAVALEGSATYGLNPEQLLYTETAVNLNRGGRLSMRFDASYIAPFDATLIGGRADYNVSDRYAFRGSSRFDLDTGRLRSSFVNVTRRFEKAVLNVGVYLDRIDEERGIRFTFAPTDVPLFRFDSNSLYED